jgi:hypothetical protein
MSETAPRSNPRLENFEANKAAAEREQFENELYGDAGTTDFSDTDSVDYSGYMDYARNARRAGQTPSREEYAQLPENQRNARRRVEEVDAYEHHLEEMAKRDRVALNDDNSAEAISARIDAMHNFDAAHPESRAYDQEWDDAIAENEHRTAIKMNEEFDAAEAIRLRDEKIQGNVVTRKAHEVTDEIIALRGKKPEDMTDAEKDRLHDLEIRLQDLLERYSNGDDFDPEISDYLLNRGTEVSAPETIPPVPADVDGDLPPVPGDTDGDLPPVPSDTDGDLPPVPSDTDGDLPPVPGDVDGGLPPVPADTDGDLPPVPADAAGALPPVPGDVEPPRLSRMERLKRAMRHPFETIHAIYTVVRENRQERVENMSDEERDRRGRRTKRALGAIAVIGLGTALFLGASGDSNNHHETPRSTPSATAEAHPGGGHDDGHDTHDGHERETPPAAAELPSADGAAYPWNWAEKAVGADKAEGWLHDLSDKAAAAGYKVEWHGSGTHEWVEMTTPDGSKTTSRTDEVIGMLRPFANS